MDSPEAKILVIVTIFQNKLNNIEKCNVDPSDNKVLVLANPI